MYRNVVYNSRTRDVTLWTWDDLGERIERHIPFKPYLYLEHKNGKDGMSIFKTPLKKREFETDYDRRKFVERSGVRRLFNNLPAEQQFLLDEYAHYPNQDKFNDNPLRMFYLDIEIFSPYEFPRADEAKHPINAITIYDSLVKKFHTWGVKSYATLKDDVIYHKCTSENDLLKSFMRYWCKNYPDVMSGWNSDAFDIPYIVNRLTRLFGEKFPEKLSPTGRIWSKEKLDRFGNPITEWSIQGISCIDYMKAYKKFSRNERESYSLDYIAELELNEGKIKIKGSLAALAVSDWTTFIDYNIRDVELILRLENKLHYLELCRMIGYKGLTKFEKALQTNNIVAGAFALESSKRGEIIPTFQYDKGSRPPGGLVRVPEKGFNDAIVSFDAASLYPNTMITLNLSPETKIGNVKEDENFAHITTVRGKEIKIKKDALKDWMVNNKICKSVHGTLFSQATKGIIPSIIEGIYSDRKRFKAKGKTLAHKIYKMDKDSDEYAIAKERADELDTLQYTLKILMNSIYGTFGNPYSVLYDLDLTGSITLTGQEVNLQSSIAVQDYVKKKYDVDDDLLIYGDTDSIYITLTPLLNKLGIKLVESEERIEGEPLKITSEAMDIVRELGGEDDPYSGAITKHLSAWALDEMNSLDPRFEFKREKISKCGIFLDAKKTYIIQVIDNEGVPVPVGSPKEFSYTGGAIVSSTLALPIRELIKNVIKTMIISKDVGTANESVVENYDVFSKFDEFTLATRKAVKNLKKYEKNSEGFNVGKGTPQNSKAALLYNNLLEHLQLTAQYEKIKSGDKIKILYVGKNRFGLEYVGFLDELPIEFGMTPNYKKLYMKNMHPTLERIYNAVSWDIVDPTKHYACDILAEFS